MSMERKETIICPECGHAQDFIIWESLNGDLDPKAKQQLIDGTLFYFECENCGYNSNVNYGILYHDMMHRAMVYYVDEDSVEQTIKTMFDAEEKIGIKMPGYRRRIVTDQNALREKAIIFEHGLDDRAIEILNLFYLANASERFPESNIKEVYFLVDDGKYILEFIGDRMLRTEVSNSMYDSIKTSFAERLEAVGNDEPLL